VSDKCDLKMEAIMVAILAAIFNMVTNAPITKKIDI
jgi:hypothetical protein